ncbi:MAG TPA: hypothetical protein VK816_07545, partial [Jatrophihabitantaceae bacterium]|nr:hypothetical protein [Jatrophihabitantaceae bacterium]
MHRNNARSGRFWSVTTALAVLVVGVIAFCGTYGVSSAANPNDPNDNPTPGTSQQWTAAPPGQDQQATEQRNANTFWSSPENSGPDGWGRNLGYANFLLELSTELLHGVTQQADPSNAYAYSVINKIQRNLLILNAAGPAIAAIPPLIHTAVTAIGQQIGALPDTVTELRNEDPLTLRTEQLVEQQAPTVTAAIDTQYYESQGQPPTQAEASAAADVKKQTRRWPPAFTASEVDELRRYYETKIFFSITNKSGKKVVAKTFHNYAATAAYFNQQNKTSRGKTQIRLAILGEGPYEAGKLDKNGNPFAAGFPGACAEGNVCPPGPPPADDPTALQWPTAGPGQDQQETTHNNFNRYYENIENSEPDAWGRNDGLAHDALDVNDYITHILSEQSDPGDAYIGGLLDIQAEFPYMVSASGPGIAGIPPALNNDLTDFSRSLSSLPNSIDGIRADDPRTQQTEQHLQDLGPDVFETEQTAYFQTQGQTAAQAATSASSSLRRYREGRPLALTAPQVEELRSYYDTDIQFTRPDGSTGYTLDSYLYTTEYFNQLNGDTVDRGTVSTAIRGVGPYRAGMKDDTGTVFEPRRPDCAKGYVCPP